MNTRALRAKGADLMKPTNSPMAYGVRISGCRMAVHEGECLAWVPRAVI